MILGITGGTGCGKTTLLKEIEERGGMVLDCDAVYHELWMPLKPDFPAWLWIKNWSAKSWAPSSLRMKLLFGT